MALSADTLDRHKRHILLKEIGGPGVQALAKSSVCIVGAGALGGPCALYLAASGVGEITLFDDDRVERSNLQRQIQFQDHDVGQLKVTELAARLQALAPECKVSAYPDRVRDEMDLPGDILIDGTDNFETRFVLNALAHSTGRALVSGAASRWNGQVSVFASGLDAAAPCYRCWVSELPPEAEACDEVGVVGPLTGLVSTRMALETLKLITGAGPVLRGAIWLVDGLSGNDRTVRLKRDPACKCCGQ